MSRRALALAAGAVALASGCNKGSSQPAFRLAEPSSVAVFQAYAHKHSATLHPYVAVANSGQDELVLFDPVDDVVVASPILIRPLSVPLPAPRPAIVASASFTAPAGEAPRPDLLVVVAAASSELQLIRTWKDPNQIDPGLVTDGAVDLGGEVVALIATPTVNGSGELEPDRVRVVAALTSGRLAMVEYQWTGDPGTGGAVAPVSAAPVVQDLGFDALSLAVDASLDGSHEVTPPARPPLRNPRFLYAATLDPIPPSNVEGVAELDMAGSPGGWAVQALNAHTPTRLVAAFTLQERVTDERGAYDQVTALGLGHGDFNSFQPDAVHRVYAYRDPASCGPKTAEACGVAVLDPVTADVLEDPWHTGETPKRYLPPIAIPSLPVALVPGPPAWNPPTDENAGLESDPIPDPPPATPEFHHRFMVINTGAGPRITTGVLFIPSEDGRSYFADLARWEVPSNKFQIDPIGTPTAVSSYRQSEIDAPRIGFYVPPNVAAADAANGALPRPSWDPSAAAVFYFRLTPGFTPDDLWSVTYQGYLPSLASNRPALVENVGGGLLSVALQASTSSQVVNVFDPALGVRVGDVVELWTTQIAQCPDTTTTVAGEAVAPVEGKIVQVVKPDAAHPGGSLVVQAGDCVPILKLGATSCDDLTHGPWKSMASCWATAPAGTPVPLEGTRQVRIRASGGGNPGALELDGKDFVVIGTGTGYAGRATSVPEGTTFPSFTFASDGEAALAASCPLIPYPSDPLAVPDCDESCRSNCETAAIARRARRNHLTSAFCYKGSTEDPNKRNYCETYFPEFAKHVSDVAPQGTFDGEPPAGPVLAFSLGVQQPTATASMFLVRDTQVIFATRSGHDPVSRYGGGANGGPAIGPMGAAYFDRSFDTSWGKQSDRYRFFVPHVGNLILDATPARSNGLSRVLR